MACCPIPSVADKIDISDGNSMGKHAAHGIKFIQAIHSPAGTFYIGIFDICKRVPATKGGQILLG